MSELDKARRTLHGVVGKIRHLESRIARLEEGAMPVDVTPRIGASKAMMNTREAASYLGIGKSTLEQSRVSGINCPPYVKLGTRVLYRIDDLKAFLEENMRANTSQQAQERNTR